MQPHSCEATFADLWSHVALNKSRAKASSFCCKIEVAGQRQEEVPEPKVIIGAWCCLITFYQDRKKNSVQGRIDKFKKVKKENNFSINFISSKSLICKAFCLAVRFLITCENSTKVRRKWKRRWMIMEWGVMRFELAASAACGGHKLTVGLKIWAKLKSPSGPVKSSTSVSLSSPRACRKILRTAI